MIVRDETAQARINRLRHRMFDACDSCRWDELGKLDRECLEVIKMLTVQKDMPALQSMMQFYNELIAECERQRNSFSSDVINLRQARRQENVYHQVASVR